MHRSRKKWNLVIMITRWQPYFDNSIPSKFGWAIIRVEDLLSGENYVFEEGADGNFSEPTGLPSGELKHTYRHTETSGGETFEVFSRLGRVPPFDTITFKYILKVFPLAEPRDFINPYDKAIGNDTKFIPPYQVDNSISVEIYSPDHDAVNFLFWVHFIKRLLGFGELLAFLNANSTTNPKNTDSNYVTNMAGFFNMPTITTSEQNLDNYWQMKSYT